MAIRRVPPGSTLPTSGRKAPSWSGRTAISRSFRLNCEASPQMRPCSRLLCCATGAESPRLMSGGGVFIRSRHSRRERSSHGFDDAAKLVEHLVDLTLAHDQWRAERQRIADGAEHDVVLEETEIERIHPTLADGVGPACEIDADGKADRADIEHVRQALEPHRRLRPRLFELARALEQALVAIDIERCEPGGARERVRRISIAVE